MKERSRRSRVPWRMAELTVFIFCFSVCCSEWLSKPKQNQKMQQGGLSYRTIYLFRDNATQLNAVIINCNPYCLPGSKVLLLLFLLLITVLFWGSRGQDHHTHQEQLHNTFWKWALTSSDKMRAHSAGTFLWHYSNRDIVSWEIVSRCFFFLPITKITEEFRNYSVLFLMICYSCR